MNTVSMGCCGEIILAFRQPFSHTHTHKGGGQVGTKVWVLSVSMVTVQKSPFVFAWPSVLHLLVVFFFWFCFEPFPPSLAGVLSAVHHSFRALRSAWKAGSADGRVCQPSAGWGLRPGPVGAGGWWHVSIFLIARGHPGCSQDISKFSARCESHRVLFVSFVTHEQQITLSVASQ